MKLKTLPLLIAALAFVANSSLLAAATDPINVAGTDRVDAAMAKAREFVYSRMHDGNWETAQQRDPKAGVSDTSGAQWGGLTSLCTYALLASGESSQDPRIVGAVNYLLKADIVGVYALGLRSQVWAHVPKNELVRQAIDHDGQAMLAACKSSGSNEGLYDYINSGPTGGTMDHSVSQYGVLGMWACSDTLKGIPAGYWERVDSAWRRDQGQDGSWAYNARPGAPDPKTGQPINGTATMTAAGVATLFITQDFLNRDRGVDCVGHVSDRNISAGLSWMSEHFETVSQGDWPFYCLYGIERIGVASGFKYFGTNDWFKQGTEWLVKRQNADGSFPSTGWPPGPTRSLENTCFALLFFSRGRAPVIINKLQYKNAEQDADWNQRPRDAFNIARWVGTQNETDLNWQITNLAVPVDELHDAPILYISGDKKLNLTAEQKNKLRTFVEDGGLILGNADCGQRPFSDSFRKLGNDVFPGYEFAPLAATHPILNNEQFLAKKWRRKPVVLGLDNGVRELMLLIPDADPSKTWQMQEYAGREELFQLAADIILYAVDKTSFLTKGQTYIVTPDPKVLTSQIIEVARIRYDGNWDPEPGGWKRLAAVMHNLDAIDVKTSQVNLAARELKGKSIAHMTGTGSFVLTTSQRDAILTFVEGGGTLIIDAAGGATPFATAVEKELHAIFGADADQLGETLPPDHPIYSIGGPLGAVGYRTFARPRVGMIKTPRLRGITYHGRLAVVYSPEDLSAGLVGQAVDGIIGYSPETATSLMRKIIQLAPPAVARDATPGIIVKGSLAVDLRPDVMAGSETWSNHASGEQRVGDFARKDKGKLTVEKIAGPSGSLQQVVHFDGESASALFSAKNVPDAIAADQGVTVEAWVRVPSPLPESLTVISYGNRIRGQQRQLIFGTSKPFSGFFSDVGSWGPFVPTADSWHYLVWALDGGTKMMTVYADGKEAKQNVVYLNTAKTPMVIGAGPDENAVGSFTTDPFIGDVAALRVETGVLTAANVKHNFNAGIVAATNGAGN